MTVLPNSAAARDIAYHLHPYTDAVKLEAEGPLIITGDQLNDLFDRFQGALDDTLAYVRENDLM